MGGCSPQTSPCPFFFSFFSDHPPRRARTAGGVGRGARTAGYCKGKCLPFPGSPTRALTHTNGGPPPPQKKQNWGAEGLGGGLDAMDAERLQKKKNSPPDPPSTMRAGPAIRAAFLVLALAATSAFAAPETGKAAALASVDKVREGGHGGRSCLLIGARARARVASLFGHRLGRPHAAGRPRQPAPDPHVRMSFILSTFAPHRDRNSMPPSTPR